MNARKYITGVFNDWLLNFPMEKNFNCGVFVGALQAGLVFAGVLKQGRSPCYKDKDVKGWFGRKKIRKERHTEWVIRNVGEYLATPSGWHSRNDTPPLSQYQIDKGDNGGFSRKLIFRHSSGKLSWGSAVLHEGKVAWWFPGDMDDIASIPEAKDEKDPIVSWALVPDVQQIADLIA